MLQHNSSSDHCRVRGEERLFIHSKFIMVIIDDRESNLNRKNIITLTGKEMVYAVKAKDQERKTTPKKEVPRTVCRKNDLRTFS